MKYLLSLLSLILILIIAACSEQSTQQVRTAPAEYILTENALPDYEQEIDHAAYMDQINQYDEDWELRQVGTQIYRTTCFSCHGNNEQLGSLPNSKKFWADEFRNGADPYSMYQTISRGFGQMPPHLHLVPSQKYAVIAFIREELIKKHNPTQYVEITDAYVEGLPQGNSEGPEPVAYEPWKDLDYGNWLMRVYEMSDDNDPPKVISGGRAPLPHEDYSKVNFAYKGIGIRLDHGPGGVAKGNSFVLFDHELMRFVGAWTGEGFIDWEDILLDDQHNVYPRTVGKRQFANPVTPGWANPADGSYKDLRLVGVDGRQYGPLPRSWVHYKGLFQYNERVILQYTVGEASVLETYDLVEGGEAPIISRSISMTGATQAHQLRIAPAGTSVAFKGEGVQLEGDGRFVLANIRPGSSAHFTLFMSTRDQDELDEIAHEADVIGDLSLFTQGGAKQDPIVVTGTILPGNEEDPYAVDVFVLPTNPYKSRLRLTGIDFMEDGKVAIVSTIDGEIWRVEGITQSTGELSWTRIGTGLFQPLGVKVKDGDIYVTCRDQIAILRDLNGDGITDFYESFNSDHQVTEHYHEFAMGLQTDAEGNFYYAKSGRHARESLIPRHGTLIKVSADGSTSEILANGFRAANGVCINPDGSFYVTDQQGFWNPMNRINRVTKGGFYGNMWGYGAPEDSSDDAMIQPMMWVDMKYDRSPSELVWAESDKWGPLNGSLLNISYGYGKVFVVMTQQTANNEQGGMVELPVPQFPTGIMRARFNPADGQMYMTGMSAWATSRMIQVGGFYRVRYTGKSLNLPIELKALNSGMKLTFSEPLDKKIATDPNRYEINTWDIKRTRRYGSKRYNEQSLKISKVSVSEDGKSVLIHLPKIKPSWIMEIMYDLKSAKGQEFNGAIQNSVYELASDET